MTLQTLLISYTVLQYEYTGYQQCSNYSSVCLHDNCEVVNSLQKSSEGTGKPEQLDYLFDKCGFVLPFINCNPHTVGNLKVVYSAVGAGIRSENFVTCKAL